MITISHQSASIGALSAVLPWRCFVLVQRFPKGSYEIVPLTEMPPFEIEMIRCLFD